MRATAATHNSLKFFSCFLTRKSDLRHLRLNQKKDNREKILGALGVKGVEIQLCTLIYLMTPDNTFKEITFVIINEFNIRILFQGSYNSGAKTAIG